YWICGIEFDFASVIIYYIICIFAAFQKQTIHINPLTPGNHQNIKFAIWAYQFVRPLVSLLPHKFTFCKNAPHQCARSKSRNFGTVFVIKSSAERNSLYFFCKSSEIAIVILKIDIARAYIPVFAKKLNKNLVKFIQTLRISAFLRGNICILNGSPN